MRECVALLILIGAVGAARADIYVYTDPAGGAHFSNVPAQPGYVLLLASPPEPAPLAAASARSPWRERAASYAALIERTARRRALQPALLNAVVAVESAFDARAVSRTGAQGLMQLQPTTARRYGVGDVFDPAQNLDGGARYLADLLRRYGDNLELALAAYNAGEDAVDRNGRTVPPYRETRAYIPAVLAMYQRFLRRDAG